MFDTKISFEKRSNSIHDSRLRNCNSFKSFTCCIPDLQTISTTVAQLVGIRLFVDLIPHYAMQRSYNVILKIYCVITKNSRAQTNQFKGCYIPSFFFFFQKHLP